MIAKQIALFVAPWCFVLLIAIGCSRQDPSPYEAVLGHSKHRDGANNAPSPAAYAAPGAEERYSFLARSISDLPALRLALISFYQEWGRRDGVEAVVHAMKHSHTLAPHAFTGWLEVDSNAPRAWVLSQCDSERRQGSLAKCLLHALPVDDQRARGEWAAKFVAHSSGERLIAEVAIDWAAEHPQEMLAWLETLPAGAARSGAIATIFQRWAEEDPALASSQLVHMVQGEVKDLAISSLAKAIHDDDPEAARLWAEAIGNGGLRNATNGLLDKLAAPRRTAISAL